MDLEERLKFFRYAHPYTEIDVDGLRWRYVVGGGGGRTILVPSGGTRLPDMYLLLFEALEPHFRVISPCYPAARTMAALAEGLAAVLDAEGVDGADLFGSSFGGFVAQCFVRRYPERVRSLVLANTGAPGTRPPPDRAPPRGRRATGWNWRRWFAAPPEEREFWYGLLDELLASRLTKADLVSAMEEMLDFTRNYRFGPPRPLRWVLRRWLGFDYDAELAHAVAHAEDLPMVELVPAGPPSLAATGPNRRSRVTHRFARRKL